ncbi:MAG: C10 family peptidase, partial [Bacteroidales bacterium]|nr:C10 family peptidase [Bacteroidales bacterium]
MKTGKLILMCLTVIFCSISCTKEKDIWHTREKDAFSSNVIPIEEALANLDSILTKMYSVTKSDMNKVYRKTDVTSCGEAQFHIRTKSSDKSLEHIPDTLMYIVNFEKSEGFAILAGDRRLSENVYCIAENGSISCKDFAMAYDYLHSDVINTKSDNYDSFVDMGEEFVPALLLSSMLADLKYGQIIQDTAHAGTKSTPVATTNGVLLKTKWTQWSPFNNYIDNGCPAGCVAIACAQIMQYCQKPENPVFDGVNCSWETMEGVYNINDIYGIKSPEAKEQVARFLKHIGRKSLCNIDYDVNGSSGNADGVVRTLKNYGYTSVKKHLGFGSKNQGKASTMLGKRMPVFLS